MMRPLAVLSLYCLVAGCAYPHSEVEQGQKSGMLYFPGVPPTAHVLVDGTEAGLAGNFSGRTMLAVAPGTHRISVRSDTGVLLDRDYYVDAGAKVAVQ